VAQRACLIFLRLVVERGGCGRAGINVERMAFEAHQIYLAAFQQSRVGRAVGRMAGDAAFGLHHRVLVDKWPCLFGMAFEAQGILRRSGAQLAGQESAVRVVAVAALHESFIDAVVKRTIELLFGFKVTAVTKLRLAFLHQKLTLLLSVRVVAIGAADIALQMRRPSEVAVLFAVLMTGEAARADLFRRSVSEREYFRLVSAAIDMLFSRPVTGFAALPFGALS